MQSRKERDIVLICVVAGVVVGQNTNVESIDSYTLTANIVRSVLISTIISIPTWYILDKYLPARGLSIAGWVVAIAGLMSIGLAAQGFA